MPYFETKDQTCLYYKEWGTGKPVVFASSWGFNADMWAYQMIELSERNLRCIAYDRRGHGRSDDPGHGYDYDTLADDLATLIERLDLRDVTLVGHSMGGGEVVRYLTRHGTERVSQIVLIAAALPFMKKAEDHPAGIDPSVFEQIRAGWKRDLPKWLGDNTPPFITPETSPEMTQWLLSLADSCSLKAAIECHRTLTETDFRAELAAIDVPTLILHGDADVSQPIEWTGKETARLISGSQFKLYKGAPHGLFITHCARVNADLREFLNA